MAKKSKKNYLSVMKIEDADNIVNFVKVFKGIENPEILLYAAKLIKKAIKNKDKTLAKKARDCLIHFYIQDRGPTITDPIWDSTRSDEVINSLFE